jgi:hypothetical protein
MQGPTMALPAGTIRGQRPAVTTPSQGRVEGRIGGQTGSYGKQAPIPGMAWHGMGWAGLGWAGLGRAWAGDGRAWQVVGPRPDSGKFVMAPRPFSRSDSRSYALAAASAVSKTPAVPIPVKSGQACHNDSPLRFGLLPRISPQDYPRDTGLMTQTQTQTQARPSRAFPPRAGGLGLRCAAMQQRQEPQGRTWTT